MVDDEESSEDEEASSLFTRACPMSNDDATSLSQIPVRRCWLWSCELQRSGEKISPRKKTTRHNESREHEDVIGRNTIDTTIHLWSSSNSGKCGGESGMVNWIVGDAPGEKRCRSAWSSSVCCPRSDEPACWYEGYSQPAPQDQEFPQVAGLKYTSVHYMLPQYNKKTTENAPCMFFTLDKKNTSPLDPSISASPLYL